MNSSVADTGMTENEINDLIATRKWYHRYEILPGIVTPGKSGYCKNLDSILTDLYGIPERLDGKRVLDIGAYDGMYTFALERRGAEAVGYDIQDLDRTGFGISRQVLDSKAEYVQSGVYELDKDVHGLFDIVCFFGVYYHLKDARLAFEKIYHVLKPGGLLFFEGEVLDSAFRREELLKEHKELLDQVNAIFPLAYFTAGDYAGHFSNWTVPNQLCLKEWVLSAGFADVEVGLRSNSARAFGRGRKVDDFDHIEYKVWDNRVKN